LEININEIAQWLFGGISISTLLSILLVVLVLLGVLKLAKGVLIQSLLLIISWLPSVIIVLAVDTSSLKSIIPLKGIGLILFPYTWDVLLGNFSGQDIGYVASFMLIVSFIALLHLAVMFCYKWHVKVIYAPFIAYLCMIALGLGLINTHYAIYKWYENSCITSGIHPLMPVIFICMLLVIMFVMYWGVKKRGVR
jgi:hypothetical protein